MQHGVAVVRMCLGVHAQDHERAARVSDQPRLLLHVVCGDATRCANARAGTTR